MSDMSWLDAIYQSWPRTSEVCDIPEVTRPVPPPEGLHGWRGHEVARKGGYVLVVGVWDGYYVRRGATGERWYAGQTEVEGRRMLERMAEHGT